MIRKHTLKIPLPMMLVEQAVERTTEEMLKSGDGGRLDAAVLLVVLP
jgi:hypothetical protein